MKLLRDMCRGAVEGGRGVFLVFLLARWGEQLVLLDHEVTCQPEGKQTTSWLKRKLHALLPSELFSLSFYRQMGLHRYTPVTGLWGGMKPAYGTIGNSGMPGVPGFQCIDKKMGKPAGEQDLPRMVRTPDGKEVLQRQFLEELEDSMKDVKDMGEACHFFFSEGHIIITDGEGERYRFKDIRSTPDVLRRKFEGVKQGEHPEELKDDSTTA